MKPEVADRELARAIMAYVRTVSSPGSDLVRCGPFHAVLAIGNAGPNFSYAIPDDDAEPTAEDLNALVALFEGRGRTPRVEHVSAAAPALSGLLEAGGFRHEHEFPLMSCTPKSLVHLALPPGLDLTRPGTDAELLAMAQMQHRAFGEPFPAGPADVERHRGGLVSGAILLTVLDRDRTVLGAGVAAPAHAGTREIVGVAVEEPVRRRGVAGAVVAALAGQAFDEGCDSVFLEAAPGADGAYRRAGFAVTTSVVHHRR